jgi:hypothetical protein
MAESKWVPLPITGHPYKLQDEREQDKLSTQVMDAYVDEAGYTIKRPGLTSFVDLGTARGIDGLYWWDEAEKVLVVSNTNVYSINDTGGTLTTIGTGKALPIGNRVSFATAPLGTSVLMAGGQNIVSTDGVTASSLADVDAPTTVRSLTVYDQYVIAQIEGTGTFAFDEVASGGTNWRGQDIATAEAKPDRVLSVLGTLDGFVLFGKTSMEFWVNDGVTPFSRVRGLTYDYGISARYSPAMFGDTWLWLTDKRRVVRSTINKIEEVSDQINTQLQSLNTVEDAIGDIMTAEGWPLYVLTFPSANRTFVYDLKQRQWLEWGNWHSASAQYLRFKGNAYCYAQKWNFHLVGDKDNGKIYKLTKSAFDDDGSTIRSVRRTGFITHGTGNLKRCKRIRLRLKRGVATDAVPAPTMQVRWREQGQVWSPTYSLDVSLGAVGQHELFVHLTQCGSYRARQYEFIHSDATDWILMSGEEEVEIRDR